MSSKLVRNRTVEVESPVWQAIDEPVKPDPLPLFPDVSAPSQATSAPQQDEIVRQLQTRLLEVEQSAEQRSETRFQEGLQQGIAQGIQRGISEGIQQGEASMRAQLIAQVEEAVHRLARSVDEMSSLRQRRRREAEEDVVKLSLAIARRILHRELHLDPATLTGIVKASLEKLEISELHQVRVHPEFAEALRQTLLQMGLPQRVEVMADPSLDRGGAILEGSRGTVDASTETQLAEIARGFADIVRHSS